VEDQILAEKQAILGHEWSEIARFHPGRTDTLVKNRWNICVKGRIAVDVAGRTTVIPAMPLKFDFLRVQEFVTILDGLFWNEWMPPLLKR
jgi:hypothetical protein